MGHRCPQLLPLYLPCLSAVVHIQIIVIASQLPYYGSLLTFALRVVKVVILNDFISSAPPAWQYTHPSKSRSNIILMRLRLVCILDGIYKGTCLS